MRRLATGLPVLILAVARGTLARGTVACCAVACFLAACSTSVQETPPQEEADAVLSPDASDAPEPGDAPRPGDDVGRRRQASPPFCNVVLGVPELAGGELLIGSLLPRTGPLEEYGRSMERAVALAVAELDALGGIGGVPLAVVACDSATDPEQSRKAVEYLADVAGVPAIIGPAASAIVEAAFVQAAFPRGVLMVSPSATSPAFTTLSDGGLFWRTAPSDLAQGVALSSYAKASGLAKLAVLHRQDLWAKSLAEGFVSALGAAPGDILVAAYEAGDVSSLTVAVTKAAAFAPDATAVFGFVDDGATVLAAGAAAGLRRYLLTDAMRSTELVPKVPAGVLCAAVGSAPAQPAGPVYEAFAAAFQAQYGEEPGPFAAHAYDAAWLLAYALLAAGPEADGPRLAAALQRMSEGQPVPAGPGGWASASAARLSHPTGTVDFEGASGPLDFSPATGEAFAAVEAWSFDSSGNIVSLGTVLTASGEAAPPALPPCALLPAKLDVLWSGPPSATLGELAKLPASSVGPVVGANGTLVTTSWQGLVFEDCQEPDGFRYARNGTAIELTLESPPEGSKPCGGTDFVADASTTFHLEPGIWSVTVDAAVKGAGAGNAAAETFVVTVK